jgi:hypothetical protein
MQVRDRPPTGSRYFILDDLTPRQRAAQDWILRRDALLWREMNSRSPQLSERRIYGTFLLPHLLDAVHNLLDIPGLLKLLSHATGSYWIGQARGRMRESSEIMGAVHEVLRLGGITTQGDPVEVINFIEDVNHSPKNKIEIDGVLRSGTAIECKLATSGFNQLDDKQKDQAVRYGRILADGKIIGVQYHVSSPSIDPAVIRFLAETIPRVRIFRYASLITPNDRVNTNREEIDTDLALWDF